MFQKSPETCSTHANHILARLKMTSYEASWWWRWFLGRVGPCLHCCRPIRWRDKECLASNPWLVPCSPALQFWPGLQLPHVHVVSSNESVTRASWQS